MPTTKLSPVLAIALLSCATDASAQTAARLDIAPATIDAAMLAASVRSQSTAQSPATAPNAAPDAAPIEPVSDDGLHFTFTPGIYLARLGGESRFGDLPGADDISLETDFELDDQEGAPNFELAVMKGRKWQVDASGFDFSTDASGTLEFSGAFGDITFAPGDAYEADFDMTSLALSVSYWQWHPIDSAERNGPLDLRFAWGAGIRWLSVEQSLELPGVAASTEGDGEWLIPEAIVQVDIDYRLPDSFFLLDRYQVLGLLSVGPAIGGDGGMVVTFRAGMRFWLCENFSLDFGYRLIEAGVESEDYELQGGLQGLFLSGTIGF